MVWRSRKRFGEEEIGAIAIAIAIGARQQRNGFVRDHLGAPPPRERKVRGDGRPRLHSTATDAPLASASFFSRVLAAERRAATMKCNKCCEPFGENDQMALSRCDHLFCLKCAREIVHTGEGCNVCGAALSKTSFKVAVHQRDLTDARYILCGQSPEFILQSCASAMHFFQEQSKIEVARAAQEEVAHFQEMVKSKLGEVHAAYKRYKGRCAEYAEEQAAMARDRSELQDKYAQKTAQSRRLQEICENLQNENERLRKVCGAPYFEGSRSQGVGHRTAPATPRKRGSYQEPDKYPKTRAAYMASSGPQASEESHGRRMVPGPSARARGGVSHPRPALPPAGRAGPHSEASSHQTIPRATISTGFRASKRRIFEVTRNAGGDQWDRQWSAGPARSHGRANEVTKVDRLGDPFAINESPDFGFLH